MKRISTVQAWLAAGVVAGLIAAANLTLGHPYDVIHKRNAFGLKDPPPAPPPSANKPDPTPPQPALNVTFTGISKTFGVTKAHMMVQEPGKGKDEVRFYSLAETEKQDAIEVLEINEAEESVRISNGPVNMLLTFETHGNDSGGGSRANRRTAQARRSNNSGSGSSSGGPTIVSRANRSFNDNDNGNRSNSRSSSGLNVRLGGGGSNSSNQSSQANRSNRSGQLRTVPSRQVRSRQEESRSRPQIDPVQQMILMEANREANRDKVQRGEMPPLPPTMITPGQEGSAAPPLTGGDATSPQGNN